MRIALVAGEVSGDILGSRLITALKNHYPDATFEGIAGKEMQQAGCQTFYPIERLSVMGFSEVLSRLPELLNIRKKLLERWLNNPPDLFIGIDAPDFNLKLEKKLHQSGILTAHYVSPSVWAWRENRVKKMIGSMDLMLTLFPFEVDFYKKHKINAIFTGHPLADEIPINVQQESARKELSIPLDPHVLAILPGSRMGEIKRLAPDFIKALLKIKRQHPEWLFVSPFANSNTQEAFETLKQELAPDLSIRYINGQSRTVMSASNQILMASGTAVLEGMLIGRPMVAAYRVTPLTAKIIRLFDMIKSKYFTLPNNLANEYLVPELIQEDVTADNIFNEIEKQFIQSDEAKKYTLNRFTDIHKQLRQNASETTAQALHKLIENRK